MSGDFTTFRWLNNLDVAMCTLSLVYGQEITTRLFHGFPQLVHVYWGFTARSIIPFTSIDPLLCPVVPRSNPHIHHTSRSRQFRSIPPSTHHHLACTDWSLPLTRLGRTHTWLMMCHTRFCKQNQVLIVCMPRINCSTHTDQKCTQITKCHE
jgi:hypothetical protein